MQIITDFEGEYNINSTGTYLYKDDITLLFLKNKRKKETEKKPHHYLMISINDAGYEYLSSCYQVQENIYSFDNCNPKLNKYQFKNKSMYQLTINNQQAVVKEKKA